MSGPALEKLTRIASQPLARAVPRLGSGHRLVAGALAGDLERLLSLRNGFYCFESALHVFPTKAERGHVGLAQWNSDDLWKNEYGGLVPASLFFAEDIFGGQFCITDNAIHSFDPETAELRRLAGSVSEWAEKILAGYDELTGYPLAHSWQQQHGALEPGQRLVPKTPFVLGGEYAIENLYSAEAAEGMRARGSFARQLANVPDGTKVRFKVSD